MTYSDFQGWAAKIALLASRSNLKISSCGSTFRIWFSKENVLSAMFDELAAIIIVAGVEIVHVTCNDLELARPH